MDLEKKSLPELKQMLANYERLNKTETADYQSLVATIDQRGLNGLNADKTLSLIRKAAAEGRFVSTRDVAAASGVVWDNAVRLGITHHVDDLTRAVASAGGPLVSSMVVDLANVGTGKLGPTALRSFLKLVAELRGAEACAGRPPATVLADAQREVLDWAARTA